MLSLCLFVSDYGKTAEPILTEFVGNVALDFGGNFQVALGYGYIMVRSEYRHTLPWGFFWHLFRSNSCAISKSLAKVCDLLSAILVNECAY